MVAKGKPLIMEILGFDGVYVQRSLKERKSYSEKMRIGLFTFKKTVMCQFFKNGHFEFLASCLFS